MCTSRTSAAAAVHVTRLQHLHAPNGIRGITISQAIVNRCQQQQQPAQVDKPNHMQFIQPNCGAHQTKLLTPPLLDKPLFSQRNFHTSTNRLKALENYKRPSMDEYTIPSQSWGQVNAKNQKVFNTQLAVGIAAFSATVAYVISTTELNPTPTKLIKSVDYYTVVKSREELDAEEAARKAAEEAARLAAEEEAASKAAEEEAARKAAEEEAARKAAEEEAARKAAEEAARKAAEEEAARKAAEEEAARKAAEEEAARKAAEEEAARKAAEEEAARKAAEEEAARKAAEEEAAKKAAEEEAAKKAAEEEAARKAAEQEAASKSVIVENLISEHKETIVEKISDGLEVAAKVGGEVLGVAETIVETAKEELDSAQQLIDDVKAVIDDGEKISETAEKIVEDASTIAKQFSDTTQDAEKVVADLKELKEKIEENVVEKVLVANK